MFEISVETQFSAAHAIVIQSQREPVHGHNWHVTVTLAGPTLDRDGLLCDFHALERSLAEVIAPFQNQDLNKTPPFTDINPSAENVARHIATALQSRLRLGNGVAVQSVRVTEAAGCAATYKIANGK